MRDNSELIDTVAECLTEKCFDCTGFYINRLFQHHLQFMHGCHKLKAMMLGQVGLGPNLTSICTHPLPSKVKKMSTDDRFSEDENKHFHRMKPCAEDRSKTLSNSDVFETTNITPRKGTKAYSIKYSTRNKCCRILIEQREIKVDQAGFNSLIDDLCTQLDSKWIQDSKDRSWRNKYSEQAKVCILDLCEVGRAEFIIDPSDLHDKAKTLFYELDEDSAEYVIREVISRIFAIIDVPHFKLTQKYCVL